MDCLVLLLLLMVNLYEVRSDSCDDFSNTNCSWCVNKGHHCYWCPSNDSGQCIHWERGDYANCTGYFYGQCVLNGVAITIIVSIAVFLLLFALVICCCFCFIKYRRRRRRRKNYALITETERSDVPVYDMYQRQRQFQAARTDEILHKYGVDTAARTNDSTV